MVQGYCVPREAVSVKEGLSNISTYAIAQPLLRDVTPVTQLPQRLNEIEDPGSISRTLGLKSFLSFPVIVTSNS